jgi:hypothetical protein
MATATAAALPLARFRQRISAAIDRHTANAAGTVAGAPVRGCWRREANMVGTEWGGHIGGTLITLSVDAGVLPSAFGGHPLVQSPAHAWHTGPAQPLAYTDAAGKIITVPGLDYTASTGPLTDSEGTPLLDMDGRVLEGTEVRQGDPLPLLSRDTRAIGAQVVITEGDGIGAYSIVEVRPADGGRITLVLEVAA